MHRARSLKSLRPVLLVALAYLVTLASWLSVLWEAKGALVGRGADPIQMVWLIAWLGYAVTHGVSPFYSHLLNAPYGFNTMWPEVTLVYGAVGVLVLRFWGPIAAYNFVVVLSLWSTAMMSYWLFYRWSHKHVVAAMCGGLVQFSPFLVAQTRLGHVDLLGWGGVLLMAIASDEVLRRRVWPAYWSGLLFGAGLLAQMLDAEELLAQVGLVLVVVVLGLIFMQPGVRRSSIPLSYTWTAVCWAAPGVALALAFAGYQYAAPGALHGDIFNTSLFVQPLLTLILPSSLQILSSGVTNHLATYLVPNLEINGYIGLGGMLLLIWAYRARARIEVRLALLVVLGAILCETVPVASSLPLLGDLLPARFAAVADFALVALLCMWLASGYSWRNLLVAAVVMITWLPAVAPVEVTSTPGFFTPGGSGVASISHRTVLVIPYVAGSWSGVRPMLWQAESGMRFAMPEGYYTRLTLGGQGNQFGPALTPFTVEVLRIDLNVDPVPISPAVIDEGRRYLSSRHVGAIVLAPTKNGRMMKFLITAVVGEPGVRHGSVLVWNNIGRLGAWVSNG